MPAGKQTLGSFAMERLNVWGAIAIGSRAKYPCVILSQKVSQCSSPVSDLYQKVAGGESFNAAFSVMPKTQLIPFGLAREPI